MKKNTMCKIFLLLALLGTASAETSLRRLFSGSSDMMNSAVTSGANDDYSCTMSTPEDAQSCESLTDVGNQPCVWCPIGDVFGVCVSGTQATGINAAEVPHFQCGAEASDEDIEFWGTLEQCEMAGVSEGACTGVGPCSWCKVDAMGVKVGLCLSEEYVQELNNLDEQGILSMLMQCTEDPNDTTLYVGSLTDMSCVLEGNADPDSEEVDTPSTEELCSAASDVSGKECQLVPIMDFIDFCMSETQANLFTFLMMQADSNGLLDSLPDLMDAADMEGSDVMNSVDDPQNMLENQDLTGPAWTGTKAGPSSLIVAESVQSEEVEKEETDESGN